jgi:SAM-dependent methyltransferase
MKAVAVESGGGVARAADLSDVLNLGCGRKHVEDAVNLDVTPETNPDVVHDLDLRPWPLPEGHFREVWAHDVVEHLGDVVATFEEIHRVCRDGAAVHVTVPHFSSGNAYTDPTHRHFFGYFTLDCLTEGAELSFYTRARFRLRRRSIIFYPTLLNKLVWRLANRYPAAYERRWAWVFPAFFLSFELEVVKVVRGGDEGAR